MYYLCTAKRKTNCAKPHAQVAELVDAHVSGACAARCAGSSPALGTKRNSRQSSRLPGILFFEQLKNLSSLMDICILGPHAKARRR